MLISFKQMTKLGRDGVNTYGGSVDESIRPWEIWKVHNSVLSFVLRGAKSDRLVRVDVVESSRIKGLDQMD